nr:prostate stem cell antigen-like [Misgurnus anguillicaudatus]
MYQHISILLLFIFITGAHSLKCYECTSLGSGSCEVKEKTCTNGETKCLKMTTVSGSTKTSTTKSCEMTCEENTIIMPTGKISTYCCDTDLCNGTGGLYKGGFLLLLCPLFILTLFH